MKNNSLRFIVRSLTLSSLLTGCKVGPNYHPPETLMPTAFVEDREEDTFAVSDENLCRWWTRFNDPFLDQLLEESISGSFDYHIALEKICQARAQYQIQFAQIFPEIELEGSGSRFRASESFASNTLTTGGSVPAPTPTPAATTALSPFRNFFQVGLDAIWEIDLFGKLRRSSEAAYDLWEASAEDARAVKISVISEVANIYVAICALQKKIRVQSESMQLDEDLVTLSRLKFESGLSSAQEIDGFIATLEADRAALVLLQTALRQNIYSLAVLLGRVPESLVDEFQTIHSIPSATGRVPAGLPGDLLRRRPDILSAERNLASATEQIGVAVADLFPSLSLTGSSSSFAANPLQGANVGYASDTLRNLFKPASLVWGIGGFITWPVLDFGKRMATVDVQVSIERQAYLTYQKTVVSALQETESALIAYFNEEVRVASINRQTEANQSSFNYIKDLYEAGLADYLQVLQVKEQFLASQLSLADSQQAVATDLIAIYKAMGGDW